ncbi:MAG TPA: tRNA (adenosine(37)-N6)-dimethylallyltransferase MiaA [Candidatus Limnocylindrales bacterium]|nr:tRNA (adenosine(37)-N6)-dimethylallyltransferase MiaA [Candidatus Limnocylindrales bacterium]
MTPVPPLVVIAGATATGKTGLALQLADALRNEGIPAEIISADSRQVYRGLDIGTAKVPAADRDRIPHHGLDLVDPDEPFSVADFAAHARTSLNGIALTGGVAILVGGTGLYLRAVARGLDTDALPHDPAIRAQVEAELSETGLPAAAGRLAILAPLLAARTDLRNPRRVARALEIAELRGDAPRPEPRGYDAPVAWLGLTIDPSTHRRWIAGRARAQFDAGLVEEARALRERYDPNVPAFSAIGYREAWAVLDGTLTRDEAIAEDARRNVAFAKRQGTWFRAEPGIEWLDAAGSPLGAARRAAQDLAEAVAQSPSRP